MSTIQKIVGRRSRQARILIGISISPYFHFGCVTGVSVKVLLEGVADRLGFLLKLFLCYMTTLQKNVGRCSRQAMILIGTSISPYFHFCVRDRNIFGDTVGRRSRQAKVLIGTSISPYFHFCVRDRNIHRHTVGRRSVTVITCGCLKAT